MRLVDDPLFKMELENTFTALRDLKGYTTGNLPVLNAKLLEFEQQVREMLRLVRTDEENADQRRRDRW